MTSIDHTAPPCPSVHHKPKSKSFPYSDLQLYPLSPELAEQLTDEQKMAGALFGITVIDNLLTYNDAYKRHVRGKPNPIIPWPLVPAQVGGLYAALFHLQQYVRMVRREPGG